MVKNQIKKRIKIGPAQGAGRKEVWPQEGQAGWNCRDLAEGDFTSGCVGF